MKAPSFSATRPRRSIAQFAGPAGLSLLLLTSCSGDARDVTAGATAAAPAGRGARAGGAGGAAPVTTAAVVERAMPVNVHGVGNVEPAATVDVRALITGTLKTIEFEEGQEIAAGQLLFTLDARPLDAALAQAEATLAKDRAQAANVTAQRDRSAKLLKDGLVPQADYDTLVAQAAALSGTLAADAAVVESARLQLQYTRIVAPLAGKTGAVLVHAGSLVRTADTTPLVTINQLAPVHVAFAVPARLLAAVRAGRARGDLRVEAAPSGDASAQSTGTVTFIDNLVDSSSDTIRIKATFSNEDHRLWPGQFVEVTLRLSIDQHAIVIPATAVQPSQRGAIVFVVLADQTVEARQVTVGRTEGPDAVIASGLRPGEVVVTDGQLGLTPGARVAVKSPAGAK